MTKKKIKRQRQHYVPQLLLKRFAFKGKGKVPQVHVFDKKKEDSFQTGIDNILSESNFYDVFDFSAEPILADLESRIEPIFKKIIEQKNLQILTSEEKHWMAVFVVAQHLRVKGFRLRQKDFEDAFVEKLGREMTDELRESFQMNDEQMKEFSMQFFAENLSSISDMLLLKDWYLLETDNENPFWVADNPVVLHNDNDLRPYGNIGFMVPGIQIYMPLSPTLTLGIWCKTIRDEIRENLTQARHNLNQTTAANVLAVRPSVVLSDEDRIMLEGRVQYMDGIMSSLDTGVPQKCNDQNMMFYNSLQFKWADQYIISKVDQFAFAQRMLKERPSMKTGVKFQFG